jgi:hypothetical protein
MITDTIVFKEIKEFQVGSCFGLISTINNNGNNSYIGQIGVLFPCSQRIS